MKKKKSNTHFLIIFIILVFILKISGGLDSLISGFSPNKTSEIQNQTPIIKNTEITEQNNNMAPTDASNSAVADTEPSTEDEKLLEKYYTEKNYEYAVFYGERLIANDPNNCYTLRSLAYSYFELKNYEKSAEYYEKVVLLNPNNADDKKNLDSVNYYLGESNLHKSVNKLRAMEKAPPHIHALIKTNLSAQTRKEAEWILDLLWSDLNCKTMLNTLSNKNIPINIIPGDSRACAHLTKNEYGQKIATGIDISVKTLTDFNDTSLSPIRRIKEFSTFMHEIGHTYSTIKDPLSFNSMEEEMGVEMIGENIAYKIIAGDYLNKDKTQELGLLCLQALLSDDHKELPVYSGFNQRMQSYGIEMPFPEEYSNLPLMYKKLLAEGNAPHVASLDKLIK